VDDPNSYILSVTAIKKVNGLRATSTVSFTILWRIPDPIDPLRMSIIPLIESNSNKAIDGEMIVDRKEGHVSIYDDGYLVSKTRELEETLDILDRRMLKIEISLVNNESRLMGLASIDDDLRKNVNEMKERNFE